MKLRDEYQLVHAFVAVVDHARESNGEIERIHYNDLTADERDVLTQTIVPFAMICRLEALRWAIHQLEHGCRPPIETLKTLADRVEKGEAV